MTSEIHAELRLFCAICEQYVDKTLELTEVDTKKQSYVTRTICLKCFKKLMEGKYVDNT